MTDNVTRLPGAPETYITIGKARGGWTVVMATPIGRKTLRTALLWTADREAAIAEGRRIAAQRQRPFRGRGRK